MDDAAVKANPIFRHHQRNLDEGTFVENEDGSISTVYTTIMGDGEYEYLIPQVWDGKILSPEAAFQRAMESGVDWPRQPSGEEGVKKLEELDRVLHEDMTGFADGGLVENDMTNSLSRRQDRRQAQQDVQSNQPDFLSDPMFERENLQDAATFVASATPVIGDAMAAQEIYDELTKEDPNYFLVGALGGAAVVGLVPFIGDAAAGAIRAGARSAASTLGRTAERINQAAVRADRRIMTGTVGDIYRTATNRRIGRRAAQNAPAMPNDETARALGFEDYVYHGTPTDSGDFADIATIDQLGLQSMEPHDFLGFHVGTPRAANQRISAEEVFGENTNLPRGSGTDGIVKELRARTEQPFTNNGRLWSEEELRDFLTERLDDLNKDSPQPISVPQGMAIIRRELADQGYTHVPYMNNVEDTYSESYIMLVDRAEDSPAVLRDSRAAFDPERITERNLSFNKGGLSMEKQMELFEDGGLMDEGGMVDEVSGNDVPVGSTREEVRDDIPAMLSEGEFVFPADVVRYFGLERLMEMRQQAKMGLRKMEEMGQMGNSDEATLPDDLPFSSDDLIIMMGEPQEFADGGMVQPAGTFVQPSVFQNTNLTTPAFVPPSSQFTPQGTPTGYVPSFIQQPVVEQPQVPETPTVEPTQPFVPEVGDVYTFKTYRNASTGEVREFPFYYNEPVIPIPAGFVEFTGTPEEAAEPEPVMVTQAAEQQQQDSGDDTFDVRDAQRNLNYAETQSFEFSDDDIVSLSEDPLAWGREQLQPRNAFGQAVAAGIGFLAPGMGLLTSGAMIANDVNNIAKARAALQVARRSGVSQSELAAYEADLEEFIANSRAPVRAAVSGDRIATGTRYAETLQREMQERLQEINANPSAYSAAKATRDYIRALFDDPNAQYNPGLAGLADAMRSGRTGAGYRDIPTGTISGQNGRPEGVVAYFTAEGVPQVVRYEGKTVFRDANGNLYVSNGVFGGYNSSNRTYIDTVEDPSGTVHRSGVRGSQISYDVPNATLPSRGRGGVSRAPTVVVPTPRPTMPAETAGLPSSSAAAKAAAAKAEADRKAAEAKARQQAEARAQQAAMEAAQAQAAAQSGGSDDSGGGYSYTPPSVEQARASVAASQSRSPSGGGLSGGANLDTAYSISGLNKGGLATRKQKATKTKPNMNRGVAARKKK